MYGEPAARKVEEALGLKDDNPDAHVLVEVQALPRTMFEIDFEVITDVAHASRERVQGG